MKIVIADDNAALRKSLKMVLAGEFEHVVAIGDPMMLPAIINSGNVDAVLLDMNFNPRVLDGNDGIRWLKTIKESRNAPAVIMITAFGDVPLAVESMKYGADDFITKPWDNDDLIAKIRKAVESNRRRIADSQTSDAAREILRRENDRSLMSLDEIRFEHAARVVYECDGNMTMAASRLGINRQTLYNILKRR